MDKTNALIHAEARGWRVADNSGPPYGAGKHWRAVKRCVRLCTAAKRRIRLGR